MPVRAEDVRGRHVEVLHDHEVFVDRRGGVRRRAPLQRRPGVGGERGARGTGFGGFDGDGGLAVAREVLVACEEAFIRVGVFARIGEDFGERGAEEAVHFEKRDRSGRGLDGTGGELPVVSGGWRNELVRGGQRV